MLTAKPMNAAEQNIRYQELKAKIHDRVIDLMDLNVVSTMTHAALTPELGKLIEQSPVEEARAGIGDGKSRKRLGRSLKDFDGSAS